MYAITGASGNTGKRIAETLLENGRKVRVIGRNSDGLQPLVEKGAEAFVGSLDDEVFLAGAFDGATAVYLMIPADYQAEDFRDYQNRIGEAITSALIGSSVQYVVNLSSLGADLPEKTGPILGLYDQEHRLNKIDELNIVHLRPTFFMENLYMNIPLIKGQDINGMALDGDLEFPVIATQDIARIAAEYLLQLDFRGKSVRELLGPENLSMNRMTKSLGNAIGKDDLHYVQFPYEDAKNGLIEAGLSPDTARSLVELNQSMNEGVFSEGVIRTDENRTETSFEEFSKTFASVYQNS